MSRKFGTIRLKENMPGLPDIKWIIDDALESDKMIIWDTSIPITINRKKNSKKQSSNQ